MSFTDVGPYYVPRVPTGVVLGGGSAQTLTNASDHRFGLVMRSPIAGTLNKVGFLVGTANPTPTGTNLAFSLQGVDDTTTGFPDGTDDQTFAFTDVASNTWKEATSLGRTLALNERFAIVIECTLGTSCQIQRCVSTGGANHTYLGGVENYNLTYASGAWSFAPTVTPLILLEYAEGIVPIPGVWPLKANIFENQTLSSTIEYGNQFTFAHDVYVNGAWVFIDADADGTEIRFYDTLASTSPDATYTIDTNCRSTNAGGLVFARWAPRPVEAGAACVVSAFGGASASGSVGYHQVNDVSYWQQLDYMAGDCHYITGTSGTAPSGWTPTTTKRISCGLSVVQAIETDVPGAMLVNSGLLGGMRG